MHPYIKPGQIKERIPGYHTARVYGLNNQTLQHITGRHREKFLKGFKYIQTNVVQGINLSNGISSCKHDGISVYFYWEKGIKPIIFHCPSWGIKLGLPAAEELAAALENEGHTNALLSCELITNGNRSHSYEVDSLANAPKTQSDLERLNLVLLDVLILDQSSQEEKGYAERTEILTALPHGKRHYTPGFRKVKSLEEFNAHYKKLQEAEQEGAVLFDLTNHIAYKIKPVFNLDLAVVGYVEGSAEQSGNCMSLMGALVEGDQYQLVARVGVADPKLRAKLFEELHKNIVGSNYRETDSEGRPIHWVKPELVMEINAEDVVWEDSKGNTHKKSVLKLNKTGFAYCGEGEIAKTFHPTLERIRNDKTAEECGFKQMPDAKLQLTLPETSQPEETLLREVFTKPWKGKTAVKKLVVFRQTGENLPKFVIHTVDYSATRKEPLKEDTKVTDFEEEWKTAAAAWKTNEIGKGWTQVQNG